MPALQGVIGPGVVEVLDTLDLVKRVDRVALQTVLPKLIVMYILVTTGTFIKGDSGKFLHLLSMLEHYQVTRFAIYSNMFSQQIETGTGMVEI